jgi:hypothetical protein
VKFVPTILLILLLSIQVCGSAAQAGGLWDSRGFRAYSSGLPAASEASLRKIVGNYWETVRSRTNLDLGRIRVARFEDIDPVLERASRSGLGTLDLFTQKELADPAAPALLLDGPTLRRIAEKYDLGSMWMISARTLLPDRRPMAMSYMIVGQGKLIIGYPYESRVEVLDEGTPREYLYEPYTEANIVNGPGRQGLFDIKVLKSPFGEFRSFEGPMGASITAFRVDGSRIVVDYTLGFDQEARTGRTPIAFKRNYVARSF